MNYMRKTRRAQAKNKNCDSQAHRIILANGQGADIKLLIENILMSKSSTQRTNNDDDQSGAWSIFSHPEAM